MNKKTVYQCDHMGFYVGKTSAWESPLEPGVFHIPGGCIEIEPPVVPLGSVLRWENNNWKEYVVARTTANSKWRRDWLSFCFFVFSQITRWFQLVFKANQSKEDSFKCQGL